MGKILKKHDSKCWWWIKREVKGEAVGKECVLRDSQVFSLNHIDQPTAVPTKGVYSVTLDPHMSK